MNFFGIGYFLKALEKKREVEPAPLKSVDWPSVWRTAQYDPDRASHILLNKSASGGLRRHVELTMHLIHELEALKARLDEQRSSEQTRSISAPKGRRPKGRAKSRPK